MNWFEVDKEGLAKLLEKRGKAFAVFELIQNAWDTNANVVNVSLEPIPSSPYCKLTVADDDPEGFSDLTHAFTLFAESNKKGDAEKRGRFNLGEKLVLAICRQAEISTTKGTVHFDPSGRTSVRYRREVGSAFTGEIRMTREEMGDALRALRMLLPPEGCETIVNGERLEVRGTVGSETGSLPTEVSDAEGVLRRVTRQTRILMYQPLPGEAATLYEMGIPVVETGDKYHVNVLQKVPLNLDRDNVPPSFLRKIRTLTLNTLHRELTAEEASAPWVNEASGDKDVAPEAVRSVVEKRFGEKRVIYDASDLEANALAVTRGYTVITGGVFSADQWANVKKSGAALPAGRVTPSPKPFSPDGEPLKLLAPEKWTADIHWTEKFARAVARHLLGTDVVVQIASDMGWGFGAAYGHRLLTINLARQGHAFFADTQAIARLLIHEFAHHYEMNHLSEAYHEACCKLGAGLAMLAISQPGLFQRSA